MTEVKSAFEELILRFSECFSKPSFDNFKTIVEGWVLTVGRKTMTNIIQSADAVERKHFSAYHRFFSRAVWSSEEIEQELSRLAVESLVADEKTLHTAGDDTLYRKVGKKIAGAGFLFHGIGLI